MTARDHFGDPVTLRDVDPILCPEPGCREAAFESHGWRCLIHGVSEVVCCEFCWVNRPEDQFCGHAPRVCNVCCDAICGDPERVRDV